MSRYRITDEYSLVQRTGSPVWYVEWRERGQKVRRSTRCAGLDDAKRAARDVILKRAEIRDEEPAETSLLAMLDRYYLQRGSGLESQSTAKRALALWREHWGEDATVADLTVARQEAFVAWLRGKGYSDGYVRRVVGYGRTATNRAWKRGEVKQVPFIELPPEGESYPHKATRAQLVALLNAPMPDHVWTYVLIRLNTGCRGDAALDLRPAQVDWQDRLVRLNPAGRRQTKKRRPVVPLTRTLAAHLKALGEPEFYAGWGGRDTASIKTTWRKVRVAAKLPAWFAPKVLRHTVASEMRRRGVPGWDVSGLLGHAKGGTTDGYAKFDGDKARKALDAWMADLARDVPRLAGVSAGSRKKKLREALKAASRATIAFPVVGDTGFEPVTPTMSRSRKKPKNSSLRGRKRSSTA